MKLKAALCEMLSDVHAELGASQFGRHVNAKLRVTDFVKNRQVIFTFFSIRKILQRWEANQKGEGFGQRNGQKPAQRGGNDRKRKQPRNNNAKRVKQETE